MPFSAGNELAAGANSVSGDRTVEEMIGNFQTLAKMIDEIWSDTPAAERPKIIGPDNDFFYHADDIPTILKAMADLPLHAFTYHAYGGNKTVFLSHKYISTKILPRQARDVLRESTQKKTVLL